METYLLARHNRVFSCPEFYMSDGGATLHPDKAYKALSFEEALSLVTIHDGPWIIVAWEDLEKLPGFY
jgi:hypothetical protein